MSAQTTLTFRIEGEGKRGRPFIEPPMCKKCGRRKKKRRDSNAGWNCAYCAKKRARTTRRLRTEVTASDSSRWMSRREMIDSLKDAPCMDCRGRFPPEAMDFDHRPGEIKRTTLAAANRLGRATILAEVAKCDLVCANCHRIRTRKRRDEPRVRVG